MPSVALLTCLLFPRHVLIEGAATFTPGEGRVRPVDVLGLTVCQQRQLRQLLCVRVVVVLVLMCESGGWL